MIYGGLKMLVLFTGLENLMFFIDASTYANCVLPPNVHIGTLKFKFLVANQRNK